MTCTCIGLARARARVWVLLALLAAGLPHGSAQAQADTGAADDARKEASEHFRRGVELYQERAFRGALAEFERAYQIAPDYRLRYNIAQTRLELQDYLGATQGYELYLKEGGAEIPSERREEVELALSAMRERVGRVSIRVNRDGAEVFIDDVPIGKTPLAPMLPINVGQHRVLVRGEDGAEVARVVQIAGGDVAEVDLTLRAPEAPVVVDAAPEETGLSPRRKYMFVSGSVGVAALIGASVAAVLAKGKADDLDKALDARPNSESKVEGLRDSTRTLSRTTDALGAVAIAGLGTALVLWLLGEPDEDETSEARLQLEVGPSMITARGHF
jgi:hypothetical protein